MNTETPVSPTQVPETMTEPRHLTEVVQVTTHPAPENGVLLSPAPGSTEAEANHGVGIEGEESVWIGRYSYKNFTVRILLRVVATVVWLAVLGYVGSRQVGQDHFGWTWFVRLSTAAILIYWLMLAWQMMLGRMGHRYELTNRRLFVDTGCLRRRRDQMELLKVQDVYVRQPSVFSRLLNIGTVVIESSEERMPIQYLVGVDEPTPLMDLIWHQARKERDLRSVKVDQV